MSRKLTTMVDSTFSKNWRNFFVLKTFSFKKQNVSWGMVEYRFASSFGSFRMHQYPYQAFHAGIHLLQSFSKNIFHFSFREEGLPRWASRECGGRFWRDFIFPPTNYLKVRMKCKLNSKHTRCKIWPAFVRVILFGYVSYSC